MVRPRMKVVLPLAGIALWFFGWTLFGDRSFAFRDAAQYYHPLFAWVNGEWQAGRIPLWNPWENGGVPVVADATSSVFYPGKLCFLLPFSYETDFTFYIVSHVLLAAWGIFRLARAWGASGIAAGVAAASYGFGGNVLFQYCNVVFLVGAAWLPLALLAADRMLMSRSAVWAVTLGAVLAAMTLGGDPQAAYHSGLLAALYALLVWRAGRFGTLPMRSAGNPPEATQQRVVERALTACNRLMRSHFGLLALAATSGVTLSAIQILPSLEWASQSERATFRHPRNIYEIPAYLWNDSVVVQRGQQPGASRQLGWTGVWRGIFGRPASHEHHGHIYYFSVGPWRLAELVWPNMSGRLFPTNRRWLSAIPAEGRVWTPSLYQGLLPLIVALSGFRLYGGSVRTRWISWITLLSALGSFGWYGVGWLIHEARHALLDVPIDDVVMGQPVGGVYWLLVVLLPGYTYFRFPAKLMVITALGLSLLAADGWDRTFRDRPLRLRRWLAWLAAFSLIACASFAITWQLFQAELAKVVPPDSVFGPLDSARAGRDILAAFLQAGILCGAGWWLLGPRIRWKYSAYAAFLATVLDLAVANGWLVVSAPSALWREPSPLATRIIQDSRQPARHAAGRVFRGLPQGWSPPAWSSAGSSQRLVEATRWDRDTLLPKYHLLCRDIALVEGFGTIQACAFAAYLRVARAHGPPRSDGISEPALPALSALGTAYLVLPGGFSYPGTQPLVDHVEQIPDVAVWRNPNSFPRAWIVHHADEVPPLFTHNPDRLDSFLQHVLYPAKERDRPRDLRRSAVIELAEDRPSLGLDGGTSAGLDDCRVVLAEPQCVEIEAELASPGLVVLSDLWYPGWTATVSARDGREQHRASILRANRVMRAVFLPQGRYRIVMRYRPWSFGCGAVISVGAWCGAVAVWLLRRRVLGGSA